MQAVLLAAGNAVRMQPLSFDRPKQLVDVAGRPLIDHVLEGLPEEIDELIFIVGYKADMLQQYLGETYRGRKIRYLYQWVRAGTAHALSIAHPFLKDRFLLMGTDDIMGKDSLREATLHDLALLVSEHETPEKFGVVKVREDGTLEEIQEKPEKPASNLVSTGSMVLDDTIFQYEAERHASGEYYMTTPLEAMAKEHLIHVVTQPVWIPVGCPEDIPLAEARIKEIEEESKKV